MWSYGYNTEFRSHEGLGGRGGGGGGVAADLVAVWPAR